MSHVLVIGGTGRTGRLVADALVAGGDRVTVGARAPAHGTVVDLSGRLPAGLLDGVDATVVSVEPPADDAGAEAVMHHGVRQVAEMAAATGTKLVLVSQIYITRASEHPDMAGIIAARRRGEDAIRASGARFAIVRPGWLTDGPAGGVRFEQGDTGDGRVSRANVAAAVVAALRADGVDRVTFEIFEDPGTAAPDWSSALTRLTPDPSLLTPDPTRLASDPTA